MPRQTNFGQTDTPYLYENLLNDVAPVDVTGARVLRPSRRGLIRLGGGLVAMAAVPTLPACDAETATAVVGVIIQVAQLAFSLAEPVGGDTILSNDNSSNLNLEAFFSLIQNWGDRDAADTYAPPNYWSIPPGDSLWTYGDMYGLNTGQHKVEMLLGGSPHATAPFAIE